MTFVNILGLVLMLHGLIVAAQALGNFEHGTPEANSSWPSWWPQPLGRSWFLARFRLERTAADALFGILWIVSGLLLFASGLGLLGVIVPQALWRGLAVLGALGSLTLLLLYLHPLFIVGILLDVVILLALVGANWSP